VNNFSVNAAELNGTSNRNTLVSLGSASATLTFVAFERSLAFLEGSATFNTSVLGDLTKMSQIGAASTGITFTQSASLDSFREVNIPSGSSVMVFDETAAMNAQKALSDAFTSMTLGSTGDLYKIMFVDGSSSIAFSVVSPEGPERTMLLGASSSDLLFDTTADITQYVTRYLPNAVDLFEFDVKGTLTQHVKVNLGAANAPMTFNVAGDLTNYARIQLAANDGIVFSAIGDLTKYTTTYMPAATASIVFGANAELTNYATTAIPIARSEIQFNGTASLTQFVNLQSVGLGVTFTVTANLGSIQAMTGTTGIVFTESANLFNNPSAIDPPAYLLTRPFVERVMVRQS
jgi:hypothetical protein